MKDQGSKLEGKPRREREQENSLGLEIGTHCRFEIDGDRSQCRVEPNDAATRKIRKDGI